MHCTYRILDEVHIGTSVRVTKDSTTVPFDNKPMTGVEIVEWNQQGFYIRHESLPKDVWVKFEQLPLNAINIEMGIIKNPITFVQEIRKGGSMVLMRADLLDYYELLQDKKEKESQKTYKVKDLQIGERVISSICKDGNVMVYLGTFSCATYQDYDPTRYYRSSRGIRYKKPYAFVDRIFDRAAFAYEDRSGKWNLQWYAIDNKVVRSLFKCSDRGDKAIETAFTDQEKNLLIVSTSVMQNRWDNKPTPCANSSNYRPDTLTNFTGHLNVGDMGSICHVQTDRTEIRERAVEVLRSAKFAGVPQHFSFSSEEELNENSWRLQ